MQVHGSGAGAEAAQRLDGEQLQAGGGSDGIPGDHAAQVAVDGDGSQVKAGGANDLLDRLRGDPAFAGIDWSLAQDPVRIAGRAPQQVDEFIQQEIEPIRSRFPKLVGQRAEVGV